MVSHILYFYYSIKMPSFSVKKQLRKVKKVEKRTVKESKKDFKLLMNITHIVLILALLGLFGYWCYLISDIIGALEDDDNIEDQAAQVSLDVAQATTIFHGMVLVFFVYFIFLFRDKINFIA